MRRNTGFRRAMHSPRVDSRIGRRADCWACRVRLEFLPALLIVCGVLATYFPGRPARCISVVAVLRVLAPRLTGRHAAIF